MEWGTPARVPNPTMPDSTTLAHLYCEKVANLAQSLEDKAIRPQASNIIRQIIHSVAIYPSDQPEAEVAAERSRLIDFAANESSPGFMSRGCADKGLRWPDLPLAVLALTFAPTGLGPNGRLVSRPTAIRTTEKRPKGRVSVCLVAGAGFEPTTFRL